ncbi:MAG: SIMPL domain-containing protein [Patescibacteria group bacterium]
MLPNFKENPLLSVLLSLFIVVLGIAIGLWAWNMSKQHYYIGKNPDIQRTISIMGEGKVTAIPDIALVSLGLSTQKAKVADAQTENSRTINSLIDKLKALGIANEDIQTTDYSIYPNYDYSNGKQTLTGYTVSQNVQVKIRQTDKVDDVLKTAGDLNLNQIGGLTFTIDNPEKYRQDARILALENAKLKADALAQVMGVKLGKVISFSESGSGVPTPYPIYAKSDSVGIGGGAAAPTVSAGSQDIIIDATISYELD